MRPHQCHLQQTVIKAYFQSHRTQLHSQFAPFHGAFSDYASDHVNSLYISID